MAGRRPRVSRRTCRARLACRHNRRRGRRHLRYGARHRCRRHAAWRRTDVQRSLPRPGYPRSGRGFCAGEQPGAGCDLAARPGHPSFAPDWRPRHRAPGGLGPPAAWVGCAFKRREQRLEDGLRSRRGALAGLDRSLRYGCRPLAEGETRRCAAGDRRGGGPGPRSAGWLPLPRRYDGWLRLVPCDGRRIRRRRRDRTRFDAGRQACFGGADRCGGLRYLFASHPRFLARRRGLEFRRCGHPQPV
jgi:hypothetical protein